MAKLIPVGCFDLIIFGGAGDLGLRKLMPALFHRDRDGQLPASSRIIAVGRTAIEHDRYVQMVAGDNRNALLPITLKIT